MNNIFEVKRSAGTGIISFKEFLKESYLKSGSAPLYHFTSVDSLERMSKNKQVGQYSYEHPNWSVNNPEGVVKKDGWWSATRKRDYRGRSKDVRLTLDSDKIKQNHKIRPYVDPLVSTDLHAETLIGNEKNPFKRRWEHEEVIKGPISFDKNVKEIGINHKVHAEMKDRLQRFSDRINFEKTKYRKLKKEGLMWNAVRKDFMPRTEKNSKYFDKEGQTILGSIQHLNNLRRSLKSLLSDKRIRVHNTTYGKWES